MMKIQTEIVKGVLILTFAGPRLDSMFVHGFFTAMQGTIRKGHRNIILDLSNIDSVSSNELGAMVRSLKEIDSHGQLGLCGVSGQVLDLLNKTHMDEIFIHAADRNEVLNDLLSGEKKKSIGTVASTDPAILVEEDWLELIEEVVEEEDHKVAEDPPHERRKQQRRKHRRIDCYQILDEDLMVYCSNSKTGKQSTGIVLNISPGGMFMISTSPHKEGDTLIIQGNIGKLFKLKEEAVIRYCRDGRYGLEFLNPSERTVLFLNQLIGSVGLRKSN